MCFRYKAEVDFDGRELARSYLTKQNMQHIMLAMQKVKTEEEAQVHAIELSFCRETLMLLV